jgi:hypothetical protein
MARPPATAPRFQLSATSTKSSGLPFWGWLLILGGIGAALYYGQKKSREKIGRWRVGRLSRKAAKHRMISVAALTEMEAIAKDAGLSPKQVAGIVKKSATPQEAVAKIEQTIEDAKNEESAKRVAFKAAVESACKVTGEPRVPTSKTGGRPKKVWNDQYEVYRQLAEEKFGVVLPHPATTAFTNLTRELGV